MRRRGSVVVVGGANLDVLARSDRPVEAATSNPGRTVTSAGGVGRNVAESLARLGTPVHLVAAVGEDPLGDQVLEATSAAGVDVSHVRRVPGRTGTYTAVLDADGELVAAVSDMAATRAVTAEAVDAAAGLVAAADLLVLDGNLAAPALERALDLATGAGVRVVLEPVSVPKARALAPLLAGRPPFAVTPNRAELGALTGLPVATDAERDRAVRAVHDLGTAVVWVRLGRDGSLLSTPEGSTTLPAVPPERVIDVTGAGDAMLAAFCHAVVGGAGLEEAASYAHAAAALAVASPHTVRPDLTDQLVRSQL